MITAAQLRAARVLLGIDQRRLAELSGLSVPTIQRMEASETMVRGNVDSAGQADRRLRRGRDRDDRRRRRQSFAGARGAAENRFGFGQDRCRALDRNARHRAEPGRAHDFCDRCLCRDPANVVRRGIARDRRSRDCAEPQQERHRGDLRRDIGDLPGRAGRIAAHAAWRHGRCHRPDPADRIAVARRAFPHRRAGGVLPGRGQSRRRGGQPLRPRLRPRTSSRRTACCRSFPPSSPA